MTYQQKMFRNGVFIVTIISFAALIATLHSAVFGQSGSNEVPTDRTLVATTSVDVHTAVPEIHADVPRTLSIPSLNINAPIIQVGITLAGAMATPKSFKEVGWYKYGVMPGERGSAVIAGHVNNGLGLSGVFTDLSKLKVGDSVEVIDVSGNVLSFEVEKTVLYDYKTADTSGIFSSTDDAVRLNLITCDGDWIQNEKTYDKRLVVFTKLKR